MPVLDYESPPNISCIIVFKFTLRHSILLLSVCLVCTQKRDANSQNYRGKYLFHPACTVKKDGNFAGSGCNTHKYNKTLFYLLHLRLIWKEKITCSFFNQCAHNLEWKGSSAGLVNWHSLIGKTFLARGILNFLNRKYWIYWVKNPLFLLVDERKQIVRSNASRTKIVNSKKLCF